VSVSVFFINFIASILNDLNDKNSQKKLDLALINQIYSFLRIPENVCCLFMNIFINSWRSKDFKKAILNP